jgi:hypothetical protein
MRPKDGKDEVQSWDVSSKAAEVPDELTVSFKYVLGYFPSDYLWILFEN